MKTLPVSKSHKNYDVLSFFCTKCQERLGLTVPYALELVKKVKKRIKDLHLDSRIRVMPGGCHGTCPKNGLSLYIFDRKSKEDFWVECPAELDESMILSKILNLCSIHPQSGEKE